MVESEAQGRLPGIAPVSVIDIGSNSIRLVVYEGLSRAPAILFNEKVMCGLGRGIATTGRINEEAMERALAALRRFRALSRQSRATELYVLATAAPREASNGPEFIRRAEAVLGTKVRVLTGEEEAYYSAMGIVSGYHHADGVVGDFGGGSLELIDVRERDTQGGMTMPLGGLRISDEADGSMAKALAFIQKHLARASVITSGKGRTFYAVGGTWRSIAKLHMERRDYPLHMMQGYEVAYDEIMPFLDELIAGKDAKTLSTVSKSRRGLIPYGALALREVILRMRPARVSFSAQGVREGYLYALLPPAERNRDPLIQAASELAILRARSPEHAREIAEWSGRMMPFFGVEETEDESRFRQAACLLADISWRAHPDYRGLQALNIIAHGSFVGITHPGRAFIALVNYYRYEGLSDDHASTPLANIATPRLLERAKLLGALLRVAYVFSASMPGVVRNLTFAKSMSPGMDLDLVVPADCRDFGGERVDGRLAQLAKLTGKKLQFRWV